MIHVLIAVGIAGIIIGITITLVAIAFMMGACPDSPKKRQEDWLGLQETMREWQPLGEKIKIWIDRKRIEGQIDIWEDEP